MTELGHEPLSWLILERYALDELTPHERARVEARLASSREDRACLEAILNDRSELPALPEPSMTAARPERVARTRRGARAWAWVGTGLAAAAAAFALIREPELPPSRRDLRYDGVKGGEVAIALYSERQGEQPRGYVAGERFKLLVTCPLGWRAPLRVFVFQEGVRHEPLPPVPAISCGNRVPWPGAFALSGSSDVDVCVAWGEHGAAASSVEELGDQAVCLRLPPSD